MNDPHPDPEEPPLDRSGGPRPDWLVGSEEGAFSEIRRAPDSGARPDVRLTRPEAGEGAGPPAPSAPPGARTDRDALELSGPTTTAAAGGALRYSDAARARESAPAKPQAWKAAASSIPTLRREAARVIPFPRTEREAPAEEPDETALDDAGDPLGFPEPGAALAAVPAPAGAARTVRDAWWMVALDELRSNQRVQIAAVALVVVAIGALLLWPREAPGVSIHSVRAHPERWDGRTVTLKGRVGDVFPVGAGHAFYLFQGRDTMVVFSRNRAPERRSGISVTGRIQTGYLDGMPRQSLFEDP